MNRISGKLKNIWEGLSPKAKRVAAVGGVAFVIFCMMFLSYQMNGKKNVTVPKEATKETLEPLDKNLLDKSLYAEKEKELRDRDDQLKSLKADIDEMKKGKEQDNSRVKPSHEYYPPVPVPGPSGWNGNPPPVSPYPAVTPYPSVSPLSSQQQGAQTAPKPAEPVLAGDIEILHNPQADKQELKDGPMEKNDKKKDVEKIHLPPSFIPAILLTGVRAKTASGGNGEPQPLLFRITDLAVLPNRIKKDLKDCFVVANAMGDLSMERVDVRLVSLHCLARDGRVAIDQRIKGTVLDADGVDNLDGKVVARWGSTLFAAGAAGAFAGIGDAMKAASTQTLMNAATTVQQVKPSDMLEGAAGSGMASTFSKMSDFLLKIAEQTMPVVEAGNMKPCTIFITESVDLEVRSYCSQLDSLGGATCKDGM